MAGRNGKGAGKVGRPSLEERQRKLTTEGKEGGKKVVFKLSEERLEKEEKERLTEICNEVIVRELKGWEEEKRKIREEIHSMKERIREYEEKISRLDVRMSAVEVWKEEKEEEEHSDGRISSRGESVKSRYSVGSVRGESCERSEGEVSVGSGLSVREIERIKRWVTEKDREERKRNVIIKGIRMPKEVGNDRKKCINWVTDLLKDKIGLEVKVVGCRESGTVVVVKLEDDEEKKKVMRNKYRLKGNSFFIENDLSWEERNVQGKINKWAKEQRGKGLDIKVGIGRVRVKGIWRGWEEIEKEGLRREGEGTGEGDKGIEEAGEEMREGEERGHNF